MKTRLKLLLSILMAVPLLGLVAQGIVNAEGGSSSNNTSTNTPTNTTTEPGSSTEQQDMLKRLAEHKTELKTKLTTLEQTRIKDRCKQAQGGGINSLDGRIKGVETSRNEVHKNLLDRLTSLVEKLKAKGVDTTKLESEIAVLKTKIDTFKADLATYKQDIADLKAMDCSTDPTAFKAELLVARTQRDKLKADVTDIRKYVTDTIKPTLKEIHDQLEATEKTESQNSAQNTTGGNQ
jgi:chromosome segregation ATPase